MVCEISVRSIYHNINAFFFAKEIILFLSHLELQVSVTQLGSLEVLNDKCNFPSRFDCHTICQVNSIARVNSILEKADRNPTIFRPGLFSCILDFDGDVVRPSALHAFGGCD